MRENLKLWDLVEKTNPKYTKKAKVGGNQITSISPQYQIMNVTEQFGSYGVTWGFRDIELDFSLVSTMFQKDKTEGVYPNVKVIGKEDACMGLVVFKATFFYPSGSFPTINSISLFTNNERSKLDDNFAKKLETDTLTKAISKLGFNADIFLGKFDDVRYIEEITKEFNKPIEQPKPKKSLNEDQFSKFMDILINLDKLEAEKKIIDVRSKDFVLTSSQELEVNDLINSKI